MYQPFASVARLGVAAMPLGGSPSTLITFVVIAAVPPALVAVHVRVVPVLGPMDGPDSQPFVDVIGDSGSLTVQWTTT